MAGQPSYLRLAGHSEMAVNKCLAAGIPARQIWTKLDQEGNKSLAIARIIYNAKSKRRVSCLAGRSPIQALVDELMERKFQNSTHCSTSGNVERLFFAHPDSITLACRFNSVMMLDSTYKTNRFGMPQLHVIGRTCLNTSFIIAFIFLSGEEIDDYFWAMVEIRNIYHVKYPSVIVSDAEKGLGIAIGQVFPDSNHLLCIWHIEKNVLNQSKKYNQDEGGHEKFLKSWSCVLHARTIFEFEKAKLDLFSLLATTSALRKHLSKTWIFRPEKLVVA
ncbi:hypothetical protein K3495_g5499 [Podosphaera aphanis]|nr:hypothetical protein K3495_g5499 [Podosphaera aphanis]